MADRLVRARDVGLGAFGVSPGLEMPEFPPPDPHEAQWAPHVAGPAVDAPTAVFAHGAGSPACERVADALLDARPGLLIVVAAV